MDLDVWIRIDPTNAQRLIDAMDDFGSGSLGLIEEDFTQTGSGVQLGHPPKRIDLPTSIDGIEFHDCRPSRLETAVGGVTMQPEPARRGTPAPRRLHPGRDGRRRRRAAPPRPGDPAARLL